MSGDNFPPSHNQKQKVYRENYRADKRRREIVFKKSEYQTIENRAKNYNRPIGQFLKDCIFAYLKNRYLVHDENLFRALMVEIRRIGTNINQIARIANQQKEISNTEILKVSKEVKDVELIVRRSLSHPPKLLDALSKAIEDPYFMYEVEVLVYNQKIKNDCKTQSMEKGGLS